MKSFDLNKFLKENKQDMKFFKTNNPNFNYIERYQTINIGTVEDLFKKENKKG